MQKVYRRRVDSWEPEEGERDHVVHKKKTERILAMDLPCFLDSQVPLSAPPRPITQLEQPLVILTLFSYRCPF